MKRLILTCGLFLGVALATKAQYDTVYYEPHGEKFPFIEGIMRVEWLPMAKKLDCDTTYFFLVTYDRQMFHILENTDVRHNVFKFVESGTNVYGCGGGSNDTMIVLSNEVGSWCSSKGWFKVDKKGYIGKTYGYPYFGVTGLSKTNSNARRRQILIHPWGTVDEFEESGEGRYPIDCVSMGCFVISHRLFDRIVEINKKTEKNILLLAF